jgi:hypothetical protein
MPALFDDSCSSTNFTNLWLNSGDWSYYNYQYRGTHTGDDTRRDLTLKTSIDLHSYDDVQLSWNQSVSNAETIVFSDTCSSTNFNNNWINGGDWSYYFSFLGFNYYYRVLTPETIPEEFLTLRNPIDLSSYGGNSTSRSPGVKVNPAL